MDTKKHEEISLNLKTGLLSALLFYLISEVASFILQSFPGLHLLPYCYGVVPCGTGEINFMIKSSSNSLISNGSKMTTKKQKQPSTLSQERVADIMFLYHYSISLFNDSVQWDNAFQCLYKESLEKKVFFSKEKMLTLCLSALETRLKAVYLGLLFNQYNFIHGYMKDTTVPQIDFNEIIKQSKVFSHDISKIYDESCKLRDSLLADFPSELISILNDLNIAKILDLSDQEKETIQQIAYYGMDLRYSFPTAYEKSISPLEVRTGNKDKQANKKKYQMELERYLNLYNDIYLKLGESYARILAIFYSFLRDEIINDKELKPWLDSLLQGKSGFGGNKKYDQYLDKKINKKFKK